MFRLTRARELPEGTTVEEYEEFSEEEKEEVLRSLEGGTDLVVNPENVVRVLPYNGGSREDSDEEVPILPEGRARVEYVTGKEEIVTETPSDVQRKANRPMHQFRRVIKELQGALTRLR